MSCEQSVGTLCVVQLTLSQKVTSELNVKGAILRSYFGAEQERREAETLGPCRVLPQW